MVPRPSHAVLSLLAVYSLLGASFGDARGIDPCPHHDQLPGVATAVAHEHEHMPGHGSSEPSGDQHEAEHGPCKCVGCGLLGGSAALDAPAGVATVLPLPRLTFGPASPATRVAHRGTDRWSPHLPNAPPLSV